MPVVHIDIIKRPLAAKRKMARAVSDAIVASLGVAPEFVHIVINEMTLDQYAVAGNLYSDKKQASKKVKQKK